MGGSKNTVYGMSNESDRIVTAPTTSQTPHYDNSIVFGNNNNVRGTNNIVLGQNNISDTTIIWFGIKFNNF